MAILADAVSIEKGHEIWLEYDHFEIQPGETAELKLGFGHQMCHEKALDLEKVRAVVSDPEGEPVASEIKTAETYLLISFQPKSSGCYVVSAVYDLGVSDLPHDPGPKYYIQYTKAVVPVGDRMTEPRLNMGQELEIVPTGFKKFAFGDKVALQILYKGSPLSGQGEVVSAACNQKTVPLDFAPDPMGNLAVELTNEGNWMFMVRYKDKKQNNPGLYTETALTATFTIMDVSKEKEKEQ